MSKVTVSTTLIRDHHANVGQSVGRIEALLASRTVEADPAARFKLLQSIDKGGREEAVATTA